MVLVLLVGFIACFLMYMAFLAPPHHAIYAYFGLWVTVPKAARLFYFTGGAYDLPDGLTVFHLLEWAAAISILVQLLLRPAEAVPRQLNTAHRFGWLFLVMGISTFLISEGALAEFLPERINAVHSFAREQLEWQYRMLAAANILAGTIVMFGFMRFCRSIHRVEGIFLIFLISGFELFAETVLFYYVGAFPSVLRWAVNETAGRRFNSLVFTSYDHAGVFATIGITSCIYFLYTRQLFSKLLWVVFLLALPIFVGYQRSTLLGILSTLAIIVWGTTKQSVRFAFTAAVILTVAMIFVYEESGARIQDQIGAALGGEVRPDYFSVDNLKQRWAYQLRGIDVAIEAFPMPVGLELLREAMNAPTVPTYMLTFVPDDAFIVYMQEVLGLRHTSVHNYYLYFVVENGLLGLVTLGCFMYLCALRGIYIHNLVTGRDGNLSREEMAMLCSIALLAGIGVNYYFTEPFITFGLYFVLLAITYVLDPVMTGDRSRGNTGSHTRLAESSRFQAPLRPAPASGRRHSQDRV